MRGIDEWTETITRVTQLGTQTARQRQNREQFFNAQGREVATVFEQVTFPGTVTLTVTDEWADNTDRAADARWGYFNWA